MLSTYSSVLRRAAVSVHRTSVTVSMSVEMVQTNNDAVSDISIYLLQLLQPFNGLFSRTTWVSRYQKGKPIWILLKQETVSGSGISWVTCKFPPRFRQITTPTPHHSVFTGRMPFLPPNQQCQSTDGIISIYLIQHQ